MNLSGDWAATTAATSPWRHAEVVTTEPGAQAMSPTASTVAVPPAPGWVVAVASLEPGPVLPAASVAVTR